MVNSWSTLSAFLSLSYLLEIKQKYNGHPNFFLETESSSSQNILESALLITDWSGIALEFAWGMLKPVIFIDTPKKIHNQDYKKIGIVPIEDQIRNQIGNILKPSYISNIDQEIKKALQNKEKNEEILKELRNRNIFHWGQSSEVGADYIIKYCKEH